MKYRYNEFNKNRFEVHMLALGMIDENSRVLDVGCATGYFAKELNKKKCETWGLDSDKEAIKKANRYCKKTLVCDFDQVSDLAVPKNYFDYVIILDVVEHLLRPESILSVIKPHLKKGGTVIVSVPNIVHASIRWAVAMGRFQYTQTGILDSTHVHFYTQDSFRELLEKNGFQVVKMLPTNGMCKVPLLYKITDRLPYSWQYWLVKIFPNLFSFQFIALAKNSLFPVQVQSKRQSETEERLGKRYKETNKPFQ